MGAVLTQEEIDTLLNGLYSMEEVPPCRGCIHERVCKYCDEFRKVSERVINYPFEVMCKEKSVK